MCTTLEDPRAKPFAPEGCQVPVGQGVCGETRTLDIINEFKRLYEKKLHQLDTAGGGDCLQEKVKLQQEWISDLSDQNEMLVRAVEELEHEATERVRILEEKLQRSAQCLCEVMKRYRDYDVTNELIAEPLQRTFCLENDQKNLLEFIRRIREEKRWDVNGLEFFNISYKDLFGRPKTEKKIGDGDVDYLTKTAPKEQNKVKTRDSSIKELQTEIDRYKSLGDVEGLADELKCKRSECENLRKSMADNQQALVEEIAGKHDQIMQLRRECQQLEDRCIQADKQTAFKEDIIKELRKEVKQLKQQGTREQREKIRLLLEAVMVLLCEKTTSERSSCETRAKSLERKNCDLEIRLKENKDIINQLEKKFNQFLKDKDELKHKFKAATEENGTLKAEIEHLKKMSMLLENDLKSAKDAMNNLHNKSENCSSRVEELTKENVQLIKDLLVLNEENRTLLTALENQKTKINTSTKLTQDEVIRLQCTIDDLKSNLQQMKQVREEEESRHQAHIAKLKATIQVLKTAAKEADQRYSQEREKERICKICRGRSKVGFLENAEVQARLDDDEVQKYAEALKDKEEIIKVQEKTVDVLQRELSSLKKAELQLRKEKEMKCEEIQALREEVAELEAQAKESSCKAANLQMAVDLYLNSINVLEATEEKYKLEIEQQKCTISNLQKALVLTKQELGELKNRSLENQQQQQALIDCFNAVLTDVECTKQALEQQYQYASGEYAHLQELNYDLEVEHCNSLQDVDLLENQLFKYQTLLRYSEDMAKQYKTQLKKLAKQKKGYEEIIGYFKEEMGVMADQLCNLQELLTTSNASTQEENNKLMDAFTKAQCLNDKLFTQLNAAEQKVQLENQMNQLHEAKIIELKQIISERDVDLSRHDETIRSIRQTLQASLNQNEELQATIVSLHDTIAPLQESIKKFEVENCQSRENTQVCQTSISMCKQKLEELKAALDKKTSEQFKLEMAYSNQSRTLKEVQAELEQMKERQKNKQCHMRCTIEALRDKLVKAEQDYSKVEEELSKVQAHMTSLAKKEAVKDVQVKRYRTVVADLRNTLMDLNKSLTNKEVKAPRHQQGLCNNEECKKLQKNSPKTPTDICFNCPCEVEFYQSIVETLKKSVLDLKKKLADTEQKNRQLEEESKRKEVQLAEISRTNLEKDKEYGELRRKLTDKLKDTQAEEARYLDMAAQFERELSSVREQLEVKTNQLDEVKRSAQEVSSSRCMQLACAQQEVNNLKDELNGLLRKHRALNAENEKLHCHSARMQSTVVSLEEKSQLLTGQLHQYLSELQTVQSDKEMLVKKNRELLGELRELQSVCGSVDKQQRYTIESVRAIETELGVVCNSRDEICSDVKNVVGYVRSWLQEQRKIDEYTARRERDYCDTIRRLKEECQAQYCPARTRALGGARTRSPPPSCQSPWSLGSQGTASMRDVQSPSRSFCEDDNDWYSTTFQNESEEEEDDWVSKVESLAAQVRKTNNMWKNKMGHPDCGCGVSKDTK